MDRLHLFISSFKENLIFTGKLILFCMLAVFYLNCIEPQYDGSFNSALIDKVNRLESMSGAKIVLLGNSNLVFGMDSEMLEQELGMPVVNMGLHGGLGNAFHEEMGKLNVCEGDIYILCHSDYCDYDTIDDPELAWLTIENHLKLWKLIRCKDIPGMAEAFPVYLKKTIELYAQGNGNVDNGGIYSRSAFNAYGDCGLEREGSTYATLSEVKVPGINDIAVRRINQLNAYLKERGAVLLVAGYPIGDGEVTAGKKEFRKFQQQLEGQLDCMVISDYVDYMYDYSYFYDYNYLHMNTEGATLRTRQLIRDLKKWMNRAYAK